MTDAPRDHKEDVRALIAGYDALVASLERTISGLEADLGPAQAGGDDRYIRRVERGLAQSRALLELLDERVSQVLMDLRHNAAQLEYAREGKMV